jgi:hypothetical protein
MRAAARFAALGGLVFLAGARGCLVTTSKAAEPGLTPGLK